MSTSPAGWQPDPRGRHEYRYWDGSKWTDHVSDKGVVSSDPVAEATPAAAATPAAEPTPEPVTTPDPEPVAATPEPEPVPTSTAQPVGGSAPPPGASSSGSSAGAAASAAADTARREAKAAFDSKSPDLGVLLSVVAPGSGHLYMGKSQAGPVPAFALLGATVVAVILAYFSFILFIVGLLVWGGAAFFAVNDLQGGGAKGLENASIPQQFVGILLAVGGVVLIVSLLLPFYHLSAGGQSGNASGFESFSVIDLVLLVVGVLALLGGLANMGILGDAAKLPEQLPMAVAIGGAVALVLIVFRMIIDPVPDFGGDVSVGRAPGILLAADAAIVPVMANLSQLRALKK